MRYLVLFSLVFAACSSSTPDAQPYDTLQACYTDHHDTEMLAVTEAITVCCIDHPIAGVHPSCGTTQAMCEAIVDAGLDPSVTAAEITTACTEYITQMGH